MRSHRVEYLLVGGYAVGYHGYPRATGDMDVWVGTDEENRVRLAACLKAFGFEAGVLGAEMFAKANQIIRMGVPPLRIEILTGASGVRFPECYARRIVDELDGVEVNVIHPADLKRNKRAAGRYKDLDDLEHLP